MNAQEAVSFNIVEEEKEIRKMPKRFRSDPELQKNKPTVTLSLSDLQKQQSEAEDRRKNLLDNTVSRVRESREECLAIDSRVQALLAQDAKRHQVPGTENIKAMSVRQASQLIQSVAKDLKKISNNNHYMVN